MTRQGGTSMNARMEPGRINDTTEQAVRSELLAPRFYRTDYKAVEQLNIDAVRGKKRLDLAKDPAPDLVVEIDVTSSSYHRLQVYADLGVTEVWIYNGESLTIKQLQNNTYITSQTSQWFPNIAIAEIAQFLQQAETIDYLELVREFRHWVKSQIE